MIPVARYSSAVTAQAVAAYLRDNGVAAQVVGDLLAEAPNHRAMSMSALDVVVASSALVGRAKELVAEFHAQPATLDEDWEDQTRPDLSRLPASLAPACPACEVMLPMDEHLSACPACGASVDVVELVIDRHGPEAVAPCFDAPEGAETSGVDAPAFVPNLAAPAPALAGTGGVGARERHAGGGPPGVCRTCGAALHASVVRGRCASCGTLYDLSERRR